MTEKTKETAGKQPEKFQFISQLKNACLGTEVGRTLTFVAVAVLAWVFVWATYPRMPQPKQQDMRGQVLFANFTDPLKAASLEIVRYDEETGQVIPFKVAHINDRWCIPSHHDYPADASEQLAKAATAVIGRKVLDVVSTSPGDHERFGVVDPLKRGNKTKGIGTRVTMRDKDNNVLLDLVIGNVLDEEKKLCYVRVADQDPVYVVELDTSALSTNFSDWIEKDLLKLNAWDIKRVTFHDYTFDAALAQLAERARITLDYDDKEIKWTLVDCQVFDPDKGWQPAPLKEDEELNTTKLNDMKWALDDLKIIDVVPKPEGLSKALKGEGQLDQEAVQSLADHGFYLVTIGNQPALFSSQGEMTVLTKDGVEYVLRFGNVASTTSGEKSNDSEKEDDDSTSVNRYLFIMANFVEDAIPKPELEPLPELPQDTSQETKEQQADGATQETAADEEQASDEQQSSQSQSADSSRQEAQQQKPEKSIEEIKKERERIEKENQRKLEEYRKKVEEAKKRVKELNERFADWYYVVSEEEFKKIHLTREDIVQKKETEEESSAETEKDQDQTAQQAGEKQKEDSAAQAESAQSEAQQQESQSVKPQSESADQQPSDQPQQSGEKPTDNSQEATAEQ